MSTGKLLSNLTKYKRISCIKQVFHFEREITLSHFMLWKPANIGATTDVLLTSYTDVLHDVLLTSYTDILHVKGKEHLPQKLMSF